MDYSPENFERIHRVEKKLKTCERERAAQFTRMIRRSNRTEQDFIRLARLHEEVAAVRAVLFELVQP